MCYSTSTKIVAMEILIPVQEDRIYRDCSTDDDRRKSCSVVSIDRCMPYANTTHKKRGGETLYRYIYSLIYVAVLEVTV